MSIRLKNRLYNTLWSILFIIFTTVAIYVFSISEQIAVFFICLWFAVITLLNPGNGIYFLILCAPFFLGNSKRPYFLLIEFFVYIIIISAIIFKVLSRKKNWFIPYKYPILLFFIICLLSFPVNIKELFIELQTWPIMHSLRIIGSSHEGFNLYYLRSLLNSISSIALFVIVVNFVDTPEKVIKIFKPLVITSFFIVIIGILLLFKIIPCSNSYLSLSLVGKAKGGLTAFAYNPLYLDQYITFILPISGFCLLSVKKIRAKIFYLLCFSIFTIAFALTFQRTTYLILIGESLFFVSSFLYFSNRKKNNLYMVAFFFYVFCNTFSLY